MPSEIILERAQKTAEAIMDTLRPYCKKIEVAGSIRRQRPWVHDIDIVLIPSDPWNLHTEILGLCGPWPAKASGSKGAVVLQCKSCYTSLTGGAE